VTAIQRDPAATTLRVQAVWSHVSVASLQESPVQLMPSSQFTAVPGWHVPPPHTSCPLQKSASSQGAVLLACTHPLAGLHESFVHTLPSSQFGAAPPTHTPPAHVSLVVHALPSLQALVLFAWAQPVAGTHESFVHTLASSQLRAVPG
jgi:hypothetical protein